MDKIYVRDLLRKVERIIDELKNYDNSDTYNNRYYRNQIQTNVNQNFFDNPSSHNEEDDFKSHVETKEPLVSNNHNNHNGKAIPTTCDYSSCSDNDSQESCDILSEIIRNLDECICRYSDLLEKYEKDCNINIDGNPLEEK